jgi:DNA-directed RNA polymerase subunit RPC12/RpoP
MSRPWVQDYYGTYTCTVCNRGFGNWNRLFQHLENSESHAFCPDCQLDYRTWNALTSHWTKSAKHSFCAICGTHFEDDYDLEEHRDAEHPVCSDCNVRFKNEQGLHEHRRQKHGPRYCISCRRLFQSPNNLDAVSSTWLIEASQTLILLIAPKFFNPQTKRFPMSYVSMQFRGGFCFRCYPSHGIWWMCLTYQPHNHRSLRRTERY